MKSSAHKALASLQHKYQRKICQLGLAYRNETVLEERIKNLESDLRMRKAVNFGLAYGASPATLEKAAGLPTQEAQALTIERLEFDLRQSNAQLALTRGRTIYQEDYLEMEKAKKAAENRAEASRIDASKWESWTCFYATTAIISSCTLALVGYKYAVLTGLM